LFYVSRVSVKNQKAKGLPLPALFGLGPPLPGSSRGRPLSKSFGVWWQVPRGAVKPNDKSDVSKKSTEDITFFFPGSSFYFFPPNFVVALVKRLYIALAKRLSVSGTLKRTHKNQGRASVKKTCDIAKPGSFVLYI
jgi:hypothetical protein